MSSSLQTMQRGSLTKVYFLKSRTGVYSALEKFLKWFPTQVNFTSPMVVYNVQKICVRTVQSDGAGEYTGEEFSNILSKYTVGLRTTAPYVHENAAIAERLWRTLEDMCRALLATSGLPKKAWPIAFRHAVYLYNRMPHPHLENKISPYEKLRGEKPDLSIVRTFGSRAWALIAPDEPRRKQAGHKLDDRAEEYKYVGHDETSTTYLLYDQENNKILRKGMVKIVEDVDHYGKVISSKPKSNFTLRMPTDIPQPFKFNYESTVSVNIDGFKVYYI